MISTSLPPTHPPIAAASLHPRDLIAGNLDAAINAIDTPHGPSLTAASTSGAPLGDASRTERSGSFSAEGRHHSTRGGAYSPLLLRWHRRVQLAYRNVGSGEPALWDGKQRRRHRRRISSPAVASSSAEATESSTSISLSTAPSSSSTPAEPAITSSSPGGPESAAAVVVVVKGGGEEAAASLRAQAEENPALKCRNSGKVVGGSGLDSYTARIAELSEEGVGTSAIAPLLTELLAQQACLEKLVLHNAGVIGKYAALLRGDILQHAHAHTHSSAKGTEDLSSNAGRGGGGGSSTSSGGGGGGTTGKIMELSSSLGGRAAALEWGRQAAILLKPWGVPSGDVEAVMGQFMKVAEEADAEDNA